MTHKRSPLFPAHRDPKPLPSLGEAAFLLASGFCFLLVLRNADAAIAYMGQGLTLCARTVIPSLFPFMVVSELLVASGAGEALGRLPAGLMRRIFGISGAGASALFLGSMCGFPVGARTAAALLDQGVISKSECEHLLTFTCNPSSAFLITAVGVSLYGNRRLGVLLYGVVLACGLLTGLLARFLMGRCAPTTEHPHYPTGLRRVGLETFTGAVSTAATGMVTVCAYVVFFSALTGAISCMAEGMGSWGYALLCGILEMTGGISEAASLGGERGLICTAAFAGWSGLSVHCQVMTLCGGRGISFKPYLLAKAFQGLLCGGVTAVILRWFPSLTVETEGIITDAILVFTSMKDITFPVLLTDGVFLTGWLLSRMRAGLRGAAERI